MIVSDLAYIVAYIINILQYKNDIIAVFTIPGLAFRQYDDFFKMLRSTSITVMKKLGFGQRAIMEAKIQEEIKEFIAYIKTLKVEAKTSTLNIIYSLIFGKRFKSVDPIQ